MCYAREHGVCDVCHFVLYIQQHTRIYFQKIGSMTLFRLFFCSTDAKVQHDEHSKLKFKYDILCCQTKKMESEIVSLRYELEKYKSKGERRLNTEKKAGKCPTRTGMSL